MPSEQRIPPQNIEAEQSVLGSLMLDKDAILKIVDFMAAKDFYRDTHKKVYLAMVQLFERQEPIDILSVTNRLRENKCLEEIGGQAYLAELVNTVPTASSVSYYARIVQRKRILRELISASYDIAELGYREDEDVDVLLDEAEKRIFGISERTLTQNFTLVRASLEEAFDRIDKLSRQEGETRGVPTGFIDLDNYLSGLQKSDLIIIAARPSLGKTSLALDIARNVATEAKLPVGLFSLEMSREQLVDRLIASQADVDLWRIRTGNLSSKGDDNDFLRIQNALGILSEAPIYIDDTPSPNIIQMRAMARRLQAEHGLALLIVDYLQLITPRTNFESMVQQVTEISRSLKGLARELNVPVLALSQLSRAVEQRNPPIPRLSDLRDSGCLAGDTLITRADTGEKITIKELAQRATQNPIPVIAVDRDYKMRLSKMIDVFTSGKKMIYLVRTRDGRTIKASANHPFLKKIEGWTRLDELKIKDYIAVSPYYKNEKPALGADFSQPQNGPFNIDPKLSLAQIIANAHMLSSAQAVYKQKPWTRGESNSGDLKRQPWVSDQPGPTALPIYHAHCNTTTDIKIAWDKIIEIKPLKVEEVYDATVEDAHNFIANDMFVHNSIEQDSDVVLFIHRQKDAEEGAASSTADIYIAKHRNGPTGKIQLYFDQRRVSFRDLAKNYE